MIEASLEELDFVQAAHHQIGNSLQSVASLLCLQARAVGGQAGDAIRAASRRVHVITRLHEALQANDGHDRVRLDRLIERIARDVVELDGSSAELKMELQPMLVDSRAARCIGLIAAELTGNAVEHGLRHGAGMISICLRRRSKELEFVVGDTGHSGGPASVEPVEKGFGLWLVDRLTEQLKGTTFLKRTCAGARVQLTAPRAKLRSRLSPDMEGVTDGATWRPGTSSAAYAESAAAAEAA